MYVHSRCTRSVHQDVYMLCIPGGLKAVVVGAQDPYTGTLRGVQLVS